MAVRDGRQTGSVLIERQDLAVLAERATSKRLSSWRSVYMALLEAAGESWTKAELARRAGVGASLLNEVLNEMAAAGVLTLFDDGSVTVGMGARMVQPEPDGLVAPEPVKPPRDERAEKFLEKFSERVGSERGTVEHPDFPPKGPEQLKAARKILDKESDSVVIMARLDYALGHQFYADKVLDMKGFERWWVKITLAHKAVATQAKPVQNPEWSSVRYGPHGAVVS